MCSSLCTCYSVTLHFCVFCIVTEYAILQILQQSTFFIVSHTFIWEHLWNALIMVRACVRAFVRGQPNKLYKSLNRACGGQVVQRSCGTSRRSQKTPSSQVVITSSTRMWMRSWNLLIPICINGPLFIGRRNRATRRTNSILLVKTPFGMCPKVELKNSGHHQTMLFSSHFCLVGF